jgi:hypothetical protein
MTLWLRATKWFSGGRFHVIEQVPAGSWELVAQSHKEWSA